MACEPQNLCLLPFCHPHLSGTGLASVSLCHDACDWGLPSLCRRCPAQGCALQAGRRCLGSMAAISPTSPSLFFQVCNCDKYLKVSRERMRQLVEGSRQAPGDGGAGERVGADGWEQCTTPAPSLRSRLGLAALGRAGPSRSGWGRPSHQPAAGCRPAELFQARFVPG